MRTVYDLVTMIIFAGVVILCLQRSAASDSRDQMHQYLPPCIGCASANYAGNHGQDGLAWVLILALLSYVLYVLKPFNQSL